MKKLTKKEIGRIVSIVSTGLDASQKVITDIDRGYIKRTIRKPSYSASRLAKYLRCPRMFYLSKNFAPHITTTQQKNFDLGNLFEAYVLGFKTNKEEKELIGRKRESTVEGLKKCASYIKPIFENQDGKPFQFREHDLGEFVIRGEFDYIGRINEQALFDISLSEDHSPIGKAIWDLKYTQNISRIWNTKTNMEDFLQAPVYVALHYWNTGELLPFVYIIVEQKFEVPTVRFIVIEVKKEEIESFVVPLAKKAHNDFFFEPKPRLDVCDSSNSQTQCSYLNHCEYGRRLIGGKRTYLFDSLTTRIRFSLEELRPEQKELSITQGMKEIFEFA